MAKVRIDFECLKELIKDEPLLKLVDELPSKETASPNYIYLLNNAEDKKAYVLKPDRSGYESIDLSPQLINVLGEGYITVDKETLNENGDVTFTVKADETLKTLLKTLEDKVKELEGKTDNDSQTLTLDGNTLTISNGNSVTLPLSTSSAVSAYTDSIDNSNYDTFVKNNGAIPSINVPPASSDKLEAYVTDERFTLRTLGKNGTITYRELPFDIASSDMLTNIENTLSDLQEENKSLREKNNELETKVNSFNSLKGVTPISSGSPMDSSNNPTDESAYKFDLTGLYTSTFRPAFISNVAYTVKSTGKTFTTTVYNSERGSVTYNDGILNFNVLFDKIELTFNEEVNNVSMQGTIFDSITVTNDTFRIRIDKDYTPTTSVQ